MNDVRIVADISKAIKTKQQQQSSDPTSYVSVNQPIEHPWGAERTLYQYKIDQVPVENNQRDGWMGTGTCLLPKLRMPLH